MMPRTGKPPLVDKPARRWWRISLRALLGFVTLVAVLLAAWVAYREPYRQQRRAAERIYAARDDGSASDVDSSTLWIGPSGDYADIEFLNVDSIWARWLLPQSEARIAVSVEAEGPQALVICEELRHLPHVARLELVSDQLTNEHLQRLVDLPALTHLGLIAPQVTEDVTADISGLSALRILEFECGKLTDKGVSQLARLCNIEHVALSNVDSLAPSLAGFAALQSLELGANANHLTEADMEALATIPQLQGLSLQKGEWRPAILRPLAGCQSLAKLHLANMSVTPEHVAELKRLTHLATLRIDDCQIDEAALESICRLPLQEFELWQNSVSDTDIAVLAHMVGPLSLHMELLKLSDELLLRLAQIPRLTSLGATSSTVTTAGAARFTQLRSDVKCHFSVSPKAAQTIPASGSQTRAENRDEAR